MGRLCAALQQCDAGPSRMAFVAPAYPTTYTDRGRDREECFSAMEGSTCLLFAFRLRTRLHVLDGTAMGRKFDWDTGRIPAI
jgi:hypothetical protein